MLRGPSLSNAQITGAGLAHLKGLTSLEALYLENTQVGDEGLRHLKDLTRLFNRQVEAAEDIQVSAALWDMAFIVAFQEARTTRKEQTSDVAKVNIEKWRQRFVVGQTSFRVRVELLNRGEVLSGKDRILLLKQWSWKMKLSDGTVLAYTKIHVELAKRYKAEGGLYHHRLDGVVHFNKRVDASKHGFVELWAYPPGDRPVANLYSLPPIEGGEQAHDLEARIASSMERPTSRFDTHLPTGERIK